ncbi:type II secretion system protein [Ruminococcus sp.]|uniref:type IV pilin protein n=1 Tax=Ruminococcus sp. TaxID=41978 RepID=UPI0025FB4BCA|nr:type II secretion system protein [Ruminococcus sp.]MBQ8965634.1 type II secretion system protein [Ruminococcus sp.]
MKGNIRDNRKGFTLIELIVVMAIVGILAMILVPSLMGYVRKAERKADIETARLIGQQVMLHMAEDPDFEASFYCPSGSKADHQVKCAGETYTIRVVARIDGSAKCKSTNNPNRGKGFDFVATEYEYVRQVLNDDKNLIVGGSDGVILPMRSSSYEAGTDRNTDSSPKDNGTDASHTDRWLIVHRKSANNARGTVEVWAGDSWGKWANGPRVRLWPNPPSYY